MIFKKNGSSVNTMTKFSTNAIFCFLTLHQNKIEYEVMLYKIVVSSKICFWDELTFHVAKSSEIVYLQSRAAQTAPAILFQEFVASQ